MPYFNFQSNKLRVASAGLVLVITLSVSLGILLQSAKTASLELPRKVTIERGDGLTEIAARLKEQNLIKSAFIFKLLAVTTLRAHLLKPGVYAISSSMSLLEIINLLASSTNRELTVMIPEGGNVQEIDALLSKQGVIKPGELIAFSARENIEGYLFPDTYRFSAGMAVDQVVEKMRQNFMTKTENLIGQGKTAVEALVLASMIEKEVPDKSDRRIIAGIMIKRLKADWPLQIDATICYSKSMRLSAGQISKCYPLTPLDFKIDSPYNTYLYKGLPPAPISNPGLDAIESAIHPVASPYWYYLSDPKTGKTYFAKTLDEQTYNKRLILN